MAGVGKLDTSADQVDVNHLILPWNMIYIHNITLLYYIPFSISQNLAAVFERYGALQDFSI